MATPSEPLVPTAPELFVRDVERSVAFYTERLGFTVLRKEPDFAVIALGQSHVLIAAEAHTSGEWLKAGPRGIGMNTRIMVGDVDAVYQRARAAGVPIVQDIADRYYGLRDFIIVDPDGFCLRFASPVTRG
jgi:catechol 2,3-dioxygenase-like lactoylglutathione lyase family enzyme